LDEKIFCLNCGQAIPKDAKFCTYCGATVRSQETVAPGGQTATRMCLACGRSYPTEYSFCPYCGAYPAGGSQPSAPYQTYPTYQKQPLGAIKYACWILAFLFPIVGIIWGIIWLVDKDEEKKEAGKIALVIAIISWALGVACILWAGLPY